MVLIDKFTLRERILIKFNIAFTSCPEYLGRADVRREQYKHAKSTIIREHQSLSGNRKSRYISLSRNIGMHSFPYARTKVVAPVVSSN